MPVENCWEVALCVELSQSDRALKSRWERPWQEVGAGEGGKARGRMIPQVKSLVKYKPVLAPGEQQNTVKGKKGSDTFGMDKNLRARPCRPRPGTFSTPSE